MGYKKSFNLVTLQLIIPLSTMTKAEYKATYGIDLDDIDIERVTLLQDEGSKNKYFVDEVKISESGFDIYAGGKILSIGSSVSVVNNAYSVANAKPIYFHPVTIYGEEDSRKVAVSLFILNNSPTEFTKDTLVAYIKSIAGARFLLTGSIYDSTFYLSPAFIVNVGNVLYVIGVDNTGTKHDTTINTITFDGLLVGATLYDGVNKIN